MPPAPHPEQPGYAGPKAFDDVNFSSLFLIANQIATIPDTTSEIPIDL